MDAVNKSFCFVCKKSIPYSPRYPERLCDDCMQKAVNNKGEKLSFYNEAVSGGCKSYNHTTQTYGHEHTCFVNGYECHADEAHMGGIVIRPTEAAKAQKAEKQKRSKKRRIWVLLVSAALALLMLYRAYAGSRDGFMDIGFTLFDVELGAGMLCVTIFLFTLLSKSKYLLLLAALLCTTAGYGMAYYWDYKNDTFLSDIAILSTIVAIIIFISLILQVSTINKKAASMQQRKPRGPQLWILWLLLPVIALVAGYIWTVFKGQERVERLMETRPTSNTVATIAKIRQYSSYTRYGGSVPHNDALLEYQAEGRTLHTIWDNRSTQYMQGDKLEIKYMIGQPDMFKIMRLAIPSGK
ncbi:MAG: hypothetical protein QM640_10490 [Niabella sp.]